jgi:hypothetical protein
MNDQVNHQGEMVIPTESTTKTPFATTAGFFAALSSVLCVRGAGAPKTRHAPAVLLGLVAACVVLALCAAPAFAALPTEFGSEGSGAGQMLEPTGVAANNDSSSLSYGDVYVLDRVNNRVDEFTGEGVFVRAFGWGVNPQEDNPVTHAREEKLQICTTATGCQKGSSGGGAGEFKSPVALGGIAVDSNGATDASSGDVYVLDRNNARVEKFDSEGHFLLQFPVGNGLSVAVGPTGTVYVGGTEAVQEYDPETGAPAGPPIKLEGAGPGLLSDIAVNATGELYVTELFEREHQTIPVRHYTAAGKPVGEVPECADVPGEFDCELEGHAFSLALDAAGDVFVNHESEVTFTQEIRAFGPTGAQLSAFATDGGEGQGFAFDDQTGALYSPSQAAGKVSVRVFVQPPPGPEVPQESASAIEPTAATVHAVINPDAPEFCGVTHYRVEYATAKEFEETGKYTKTAPAPEGELPRSFNDDPVEVPVSGLSTRTTYYFRFVASDECEETKGVETKHTTEGTDETFTTQPPALVEEEFVTDVRSTSATLHATINPLGTATEYNFEYDTRPYAVGEAAHGTSIPIPDEQLGSGKAGVAVEQHVQGLSAGQTYYYRVVTANTIAGIPEVEEGAEREFTTETGGEAGLPDGREWELVSSPDKHGALVIGTSEREYIQAAADGGGIVYPATNPTEAEPHGNGETMQVLAQRGGAGASSSTGWGNVDLAAPHDEGLPSGFEDQMAYRAFSAELSSGALQPQGSFEPALSSVATEQTAYLRDSATGAFTPLVIGCRPSGECPADRNDTTEHPFMSFGEETAGEGCLDVICGPEFLDGTPDFSHVVVGHGPDGRSVPLLEGAPADSLYEWNAGQLALVSELPENPPAVEGGPSLGGSGGGDLFGSVTPHAISNDGSRVFWSEPEVGASGAQLLFMRDMTREETIEIGTGPVNFEGANTAGTLVFYSGKECEVVFEGPGLKCEPVREAGGKPVEDGKPNPERQGDLGVLATSEDGSWAYFLEGESIYVRHGSEPARLVASNIGEIKNAVTHGPPNDPWRASPNGEWFAFMSDSPLTGYDNHDAVTGEPDEEVYLYHAGSAGGAGSLVCASCDPTGARPHGIGGLHLNLANYAMTWGKTGGGETWLAATVPGWAPYSGNKAIYDPRFLSDSGRLFFNSVGGLVPKDVNEQVDVYELEPAGVGSCTTSTRTGTVVYSPAADGCVALISNGESNEESVFEDASETGEDVFFLSSSRLSTADLDGSVSVWDAHVCGAEGVPCTSAPVSPPACTTEASCKASPTPQPTIYQAPASATFNGPGNVTPAPTVTKKVTKKAVKCKKHFLKNAKGRCVKEKSKPSKKAKKASRATNDRRPGR